MEVCFFSQMNRGPLNGNTFLKVCTVSVGNIHLINKPNGFQASSSACKAFSLWICLQAGVTCGVSGLPCDVLQS